MNQIAVSKPVGSSPAVRAWLVRLHELTAGVSTTKDATDRIELVLEQLAVGRFTEGAFTKRSLEHVASLCRFWPSYGELCQGLTSWLKGERDALGQYGWDRPDENGLTATDRSWMAYWHKTRADLFAVEKGFRWGSREADLEHLKALVRHHSPAAWQVIDPDSVVVYARPTDDQVAEVARALRMPGGPLAGRPIPEEPRPPRPVHLTGEALRKARQARGVKVSA